MAFALATAPSRGYGEGVTRSPDFEQLYRKDADPYRSRTSWYERRKRDVALASLAAERYVRAWDAACGPGDLAVDLLDRCDDLLATDVSTTAVGIAEGRLQGRGRTGVCALPDHPGEDGFDLVVLSEVCYYLPEADRLATYALVDAVAAPDAELLTVTWRHHPHDAHLSGADATNELVAWFEARGWSGASRHDDTDFIAATLVLGTHRTPPPETS